MMYANCQQFDLPFLGKISISSSANMQMSLEYGICECAPNWQWHSQWIHAHLLAIHWMQMSKSVNSQICIHCLYERALYTAPKNMTHMEVKERISTVQVWNIYKRINAWLVKWRWGKVRWHLKMHWERSQLQDHHPLIIDDIKRKRNVLPL